MRTGATLIAATAAAAAVAAGPAGADWEPADSYPQLAAPLTVARAAWPDSPCRGIEQVRYLPSDGISEGFAADSPTRFAAGLAYVDGSCRIDLSDRLSGYDLCEVLVHETGHLAGRTHSTDRTSVMYVTPNGHYEPCQTAMLPPVTSRDVRRAVGENGIIRLGIWQQRVRIGRCLPTGHNAGVCRVHHRGEGTATVSVARRWSNLIQPDDDQVSQRFPMLARQFPADR